MFADMEKQHAVSAPKLVGTVPAERLGPAVIEAIEKDLPDSILMKGTPRLNVAMSVLAPRFFEKLVRWLNLAGAFRTAAKATR